VELSRGQDGAQAEALQAAAAGAPAAEPAAVGAAARGAKPLVLWDLENIPSERGSWPSSWSIDDFVKFLNAEIKRECDWSLEDFDLTSVCKHRYLATSGSASFDKLVDNLVTPVICKDKKENGDHMIKDLLIRHSHGTVAVISNDNDFTRTMVELAPYRQHPMVLFRTTPNFRSAKDRLSSASAIRVCELKVPSERHTPVDHLKEVMTIPAEAVGYVIGTSGARKKDIEEATGCSINIKSRNGEVALSGKREQIDAARSRIQSMVDHVKISKKSRPASRARSSTERAPALLVEQGDDSNAPATSEAAGDTIVPLRPQGPRPPRSRPRPRTGRSPEPRTGGGS
jgi:hypothetical protein